MATVPEISWERLTDPQSGLSVLVMTNGASCFYTFVKTDDPTGDLTEPYFIPDESRRVSEELINRCGEMSRQSGIRITHFIARELLINRLNEMDKDPLVVMQSVL